MMNQYPYSQNIKKLRTYLTWTPIKRKQGKQGKLLCQNKPRDTLVSNAINLFTHFQILRIMSGRIHHAIQISVVTFALTLDTTKDRLAFISVLVQNAVTYTTKAE